MRQLLLISAAALVLSTSLSVLAQTAPPARIANVYDWRHHQPTQQQVDAAKAEAGLSPSCLNRGQVDQVKKEVAALLKQTDELDARSDEDLKGYSNVNVRASR